MSQAALVKAAKAMSEGLRALTERRLAGKIDSDAWYDGAYDEIHDGHLAAWLAGRQMAGVDGPVDDDDRRQARRLADFQSEYLDNFRDKLDDGGYEGDGDAAKAGQRCDLYALSIRGSASEAWASSQNEDDEIDWVLGDAEHCDDCIALAAQSPYTGNTLYAYPGQGDTECGMHCHCHLATASGEGPKRISLYP